MAIQVFECPGYFTSKGKDFKIKPRTWDFVIANGSYKDTGLVLGILPSRGAPESDLVPILVERCPRHYYECPSDL